MGSPAEERGGVRLLLGVEGRLLGAGDRAARSADEVLESGIMREDA